MAIEVKINVEDNSEEISVNSEEVKVKYYKDHSRLTNRDAKDQHPISSITGLDGRLSELNNKVDNSLKDIDYNSLKNTPTFKTVNGHNIQGSGDIVLGAGGEVITTAYPMKFKGKKLSILGDSISTFGTPNQSNATGTWTYPGNRCRYPQANLFTQVDNMYWKILMDKMGLEFGINDSWAGSRIACTSTSDSGDQGPNRCISSQTRISHLGENGTPDIIIVYGGTNDIGGSVSLGTFNPDAPITFKTLTTTPPTSPAELTDEQLADLVDTNFASACVAMFARLQRTYPEAIILCMLPNYCKSYYGSTYGKLKKYCDVLKDVCEYFGVEVVDTRKVGLGLMDMSDDTYTSALPDGIHPGVKGHQLMAEYLFNVLDTHYLIPQALGYDIPSSGSESNDSSSDSSGDSSTTTKITRTTTNSHAQSIPSNATASTNLADVLTIEQDYYGSSGWIGNGGTGVSITFPVVPGDKIKANSFGPSSENGHTQSGIRVTFFKGDTCLISKSPSEILSEYTTNGYITVPSGADAVNVPFWTASTKDNECYLLTMTDLSAGGTSGGVDEEDTPTDTPSGGTTDDGITWYTNEIETAGISKLTNTAVATGYGWAQYEPYQALIRNKKINVVKFVSTESSGTVTIGKVPYEKASTGELIVTKTWNSSNKGSNNLVTLELGTDITITGTEMIVFSYGQYGTAFKYGSTSSQYKGFYGRVPYVDTANGGTGSDWSLADGYTLGVDYGYKG